MSIRTTTIDIVKGWANIQAINNTLTELCVLWATGNPTLPCAPALQPLIGDLKQGFPGRNLGGLRPSDMMGSGSIKTVEALISFIASSPSSAQPFGLVSTKTLAEFGLIGATEEKPAARKAATSSKSKGRASKSKTSSRKKTKATAKKGRKRSTK